MAAPSKQVRLPFDKMTEAGLRPTATKFEKHGLKVVKIEGGNTARRESGFLVKDATFTFEDGQKMVIRVKADGTVFQVRLNKKVIPLKHVDDVDRAIVEMVDYVQDNAKKYAASRERTERKKKLDLDIRPIRTSRLEKLEQTRAALAEAQAANEELSRQADEGAASSTGLQGELANLEAELKTETEKTASLEAELKTLEAA